MRRNKDDDLIKVWTVIPNDMEKCTVYCSTKAQADSWAGTYKSGAQVFEQEMPRRIVERKGLQIVKRGHGL